MATTTKNKRFKAANEGRLINASSSPGARKMLGGKTLGQVGAEFDLADEDLGWGWSENTKTGTEIMNVIIRIKGVRYRVPMSRGLNGKEEYLKDPGFLLNCMFRETFLSVKNDDGVTPKLDDKGDVVLDETKPYLSFGNPDGLVITRTEKMFEPLEEADETDPANVGGTANVNA